MGKTSNMRKTGKHGQTEVVWKMDESVNRNKPAKQVKPVKGVTPVKKILSQG